MCILSGLSFDGFLVTKFSIFRIRVIILSFHIYKWTIKLIILINIRSIDHTLIFTLMIRTSLKIIYPFAFVYTIRNLGLLMECIVFGILLFLFLSLVICFSLFLDFIDDIDICWDLCLQDLVILFSLYVFYCFFLYLLVQLDYFLL